MMPYRAEIDGLRAIAVLPVILFHAGLDWFSGGYIGVDIFFVISGYLITSILLSSMENGTYSLVQFYERRARRILPALFVTVLACSAYAYVVLPPSRLEDYAQSVFSVAIFASNIFFWLESGYFEQASELKPLLHTWSLAIEEQFYIIFPPLLYFLFRYFRDRMVPIIVLIFWASLILCVYGAFAFPSANFYLLPTRAWELLAGSLCAIWLRRNNAIGSDVAAFMGMGLVLAPVILFSGDTPFPSHFAIPVVAGTCMIIVFAQKGTLSARVLSFRPFVSVGLISYSAYLFHQPMFAFARVQSNGHPPPELMLGLSALALLLAYVSWRFVEAPFRNRQRITRRQIAATSMAGIVGLAAFGTSGHLTEGMPKRFELSSTQEAYRESALASPLRGDCHTEGQNYLRPAEACTYFEGREHFAVIGDSHAVEFSYALADLLRPTRQSLRHMSFSSCRPSARSADFETSCQAWTRDALDFVTASNSIHTVLLVYRISLSQNDALFSELIAMADELSQSKRTVIVIQAPEPIAHISDSVFRGAIDETGIAGRTRTDWNRQIAFTRSALAASDLDILVVDPADRFCDSANCFAGRNGISYFFDDHHPSLAGARLIADQVLQTLEIGTNGN